MFKYYLLTLKVNHQRCKTLLFLGDINCISPLFLIEAFAVCENYSPPEGFKPKDLHRLLEKVGSPSGGSDLGKKKISYFQSFENLKLFKLDTTNLCIVE